MQKHLLFLLLFISLITLNNITAQDASSNMSKLSTWDDNTVVPNSGLYFNEVWGYVDGSGNEYAVIGSPEEVHFIDVTVGTSPVFKQAIGGTYNSIWRDFKSYGNYVYGVHDNGSGTFEGLSIYDMSALPGGAITKTNLTTDFGRAHNIFIDEPNKRLYVAGSNTQSGGLIVYDLTNPASPTLLKSFSLLSYGGYVHDLFVRDNIAYCNSASGANGGMWVYDLNNLNTVVNYAQEETGGYNHSSWMTDDNNYVVYATETSNFPLYIVNVSDVANGNITNSKSFKQSNPVPTTTNNIAHNPLIKGDYCYVSYYEDGVQVWDISDPADPTLAGYYDMVYNPSAYHATDRGVWGVYPFLPSGNILVSDDINGLYVLRLNVTLPVELVDFNAKPIQNETVKVEWSTAFEINNQAFEIERSQDGLSFEAIGTIDGGNNSSETIQYSFIDGRPYQGISYYRLKQIDFDLEYEYSDIVQVEIKTKSEDIILFPNPIQKGKKANLQFTYSQEGEAIIGIYDYMGKQLIQQTYNIEEALIPLDIQELSSGIYILKIEIDGQFQVKKFIISK